jgi:ankyrin repeat protein
LAVLGDSFIWGDGIPWKETWNHKLEHLFSNDPNYDVEVIHWGRNGWSTKDELNFLMEEGMKYELDGLIVGWGVNDPDVGRIKEIRLHWQEAPRWSLVRRLIPYTFALVSSGINNIVYKTSTNYGYNNWLNRLYTEENLNEYRKVLAMLALVTRKRDLPLLIVMTPNNHSERFIRYYGAVIPLLEELQIPYLNLYPAVKEELGHMPNYALRANPADGHPGKDLTELFSRHTYAYVKAHFPLERDGWTAFRYAAQISNRAMLDLCVSKGAEVSDIHRAVCVGDLPRVESLLDQGVDINIQDEMGWTPLFWAATMGQQEVGEWLVSHGAQVDTKANSGWTPLWQAVYEGALDFVELLISNGAGVNDKDNRGMTSLHYAAIRGNREIAELLIEKGADINAKDHWNWTPLHTAVFEGQHTMVRMLISQGANIDARDRETRTPLWYAQNEGKNEIADLLLSKGADVNASLDLHLAIQQGDEEQVELLLGQGADVNIQDDYGRTPLHVASMNGDVNMVELLVSKGADVNVVDNYGFTPLHHAIGMNDVNMAELLIKKGADVNVRTEQTHHSPPLNMAAKQGNEELVKLLLAHGAEVNCQGGLGQTPLERAMLDNHDRVVELLLSHGADIPPLHLALYYKDEAKAKELIEAGVNVNKRTPYGTSPLHRAINAGLADIALLLIEKGANVNAKDNWDWTPLHSAVFQGQPMVSILVSKGADIDAKDGGDRTALSYAEEEGCSEIVEILTKAAKEEKDPSK